MAEVEFVQDIEGLGKLYACYADFHKQLKLFKEKGIKYPISVRNAAYARLHNGPKDWTRTCHAPVWHKDAKLIVTKVSPLVKSLNMAEEAVEANRNNKYFSTNNNKLYEECAGIAEEDSKKAPEKRRAIFMPFGSEIRLHKEDENSLALFEDTAEDYFNKFAPNGITFLSPDRHYTSDKNGTGVSYLWFGSHGYGSDLLGNYRDLYDDGRAFGVSRSRGRAEGVAKNLPYSIKELQSAIKTAEGVMKGNLGNSKLENIVEFLNKLKK